MLFRHASALLYVPICASTKIKRLRSELAATTRLRHLFTFSHWPTLRRALSLGEKKNHRETRLAENWSTHSHTPAHGQQKQMFGCTTQELKKPWHKGSSPVHNSVYVQAAIQTSEWRGRCSRHELVLGSGWSSSKCIGMQRIPLVWVPLLIVFVLVLFPRTFP